MTAAKKSSPRLQKKLPYRTRRPPSDDPMPVACYRYGGTVIVRYLMTGPAVLTPAEARALAAVLTREADLAEATPRHGKTPWTRTSQLPDGNDASPM